MARFGRKVGMVKTTRDSAEGVRKFSYLLELLDVYETSGCVTYTMGGICEIIRCTIYFISRADERAGQLGQRL